MFTRRHNLVAAIGAVMAMLSVMSCRETPTAVAIAPTALARVTTSGGAAPATLQWNDKMIALAGKYVLRPTVANRTYMLVSVAEAVALDAIRRDDESNRADEGQSSRAAALGGAAITVLTYLFPAEQAALEGTLATLRAGAPNADRFDAAAAIGRRAGQVVVDRAKTDGSDAVVIPVIPVGPGYWKSPGNILTPQWPFVRPMLMTSGSQFRPGPPPAFGSAEFLAARQRVRTFSDTRTPEQLAILNFWNDPGPVGQHGGHWNRIAVEIILRDHLNEQRAVHVLESLNLALSDASIACLDAKYTYWYVRPYQADPLITTPIGQPLHPSYPSLHSCQGGAAVGVLEHEFPRDAESLEAMGAEMDLSREWAGLHYWFDTKVGTEIGHHVADLANAAAARKR